MSDTRSRLIERAREATRTLRDAVREGRRIDFRERDELVMAIHDALDAHGALMRAFVAAIRSQPAGRLRIARVELDNVDASDHIGRVNDPAADSFVYYVQDEVVRET